MSDPVVRLCGGALAGAAATAPMTAVMAAWNQALPEGQQERLPPRQITRNAAWLAGVNDLSEPAKEGLTAAAHFGYGAAAGAAFALIAPHLPAPPVLSGVGYGLAVWAAGYLGWLPATGLHRGALNEPTGRNAMNIASHVVYGAALGLLTEALAGDGGTRVAR
jgi:hypothetical protein